MSPSRENVGTPSGLDALRHLASSTTSGSASRISDRTRSTSCPRQSSAMSRPLCPGNDPQIPIGSVAEGAERLLVGLAVVGGDSRLHRLELDDDRPGLLAPLEGRLRVATREEPTAGLAQGRAGELGVRLHLVGVVHRLVDADPVRTHVADPTAYAHPQAVE